MLSSILQVSGPIIALILMIIYYAIGGRSVWMAVVTAPMWAHFIGDIMAAFIRPGVIKIAGFDVKQIFQPAYFSQFLGLSLMVMGWLLKAHHHYFADDFFYLGGELAVVGFIWGIIYNPMYKAPAS